MSKKYTKAELLKPTPQQIRHRNRIWANALLENGRKARGEMFECKGGRCCLAVAQDVAIACGVDAPRQKGTMLPPLEVARFFGWKSECPDLSLYTEKDGWKELSAAKINDGYPGAEYIPDVGLSHKKIAELVLNTFVHPKDPIQSFSL